MSDILRKPTGFLDKFTRKPGDADQVTHYCPGCGHGRIHKLIAEAIETLDINDKTVFVSPVGCSVFGYYYFNTGNVQAAHGRAPAVGTGLARSNEDGIVISYQGDGDLGAIGTAEIIHAANRGENMAVFFVNNGIYGMTGGQMAPTTLEGQKTTTSPYGRDVNDVGAPLKMCELISQLDAPVYVERVSVSDVKNIMKAKKAINKALKAQTERKGFTFVEILSACPIGWKMRPVDAVKRLIDEMEAFYPVKGFKDELETRGAKPKSAARPSDQEILKVLDIKEGENIFGNDKKFIENFPTQKIRFAGFGGQGVLMAGTTSALLAMEHGLEVTWLPSYGPEMRGGTANCHVVLANKPIGTPIVDKMNVLVAMNSPSLDQFENSVEKGGLILVNSSIVDRKVKRTDVKAVYVPMTEIAEKCDLIQASNMVAVTAYLAVSGVIKVESLKTLVEKTFKKKFLIPKNIEVIDAAYDYVKKNCM